MANLQSPESCARAIYEHMLSEFADWFIELDIAVALDIKIGDVHVALSILEREGNIEHSGRCFRLTSDARAKGMRDRIPRKIQAYMISSSKTFFAPLDIANKILHKLDDVKIALVLLQFENRIQYSDKGWSLTIMENDKIKILEQKLVLTFDPTEIEPLNLHSANLHVIVPNLRSLYEKSRSLKDSTGVGLGDTLRSSMKHSLRNPLLDSIWSSAWNRNGGLAIKRMWDLVRSSIMNSMRKLMWPSMDGAINITMWDAMKEPLWSTAIHSIWDAKWASIFMNISKDEYETLFEDTNFIKKLPFETMKELCSLHQWFTRHGLLVTKSFKKSEYIVISWKDPKQIRIIDISQGVLA